MVVQTLSGSNSPKWLVDDYRVLLSPITPQASPSCKYLSRILLGEEAPQIVEQELMVHLPLMGLPFFFRPLLHPRVEELVILRDLSNTWGITNRGSQRGRHY